MALVLLNGSTATIDISIASNSYKCLFTYVSADFNREFTEATTFCNSGWRSRTPGMRQVTGRGEGFLGKGTAPCDPSLNFTDQVGVAIVITYDTSCTLSFTGHVSNVHTGIRAAANSEFAVSFESTGSCTTSWTTS